MSKLGNGGIRMKNARETYVEQLPFGRGLTPCMNKKRKPFTHLNSVDDIDLAYRSTPDYLRQLAQQDSLQPTELILAKNIPRTKSASEMTPRNYLNRSTTGNPKYKAQEDYYDDIQSMKREMKTVKDENSNLRAKIRRLEEDNARKRKEIDALYDTAKDGDLRRTLTGPSTDRNNNSSVANVVMSLKQRIFKLELQLKQKEITIDELKCDPRWTKSTELEVQNRALFSELERQKVVRLNYIHENDYGATLSEEKKNAVRKLNSEKDDFKKENENLKRRLQEFEHGEQPSVGRSDRKDSEGLQKKINDLQRDCNNYEEELAKIRDDLKLMRRERDQFRDQLDQANEDRQVVTRERDTYPNAKSTGRSSPLSRHDEGQYPGAKSSSAHLQRPQSPRSERGSGQLATIPSRRDSSSSEGHSKSASKSSVTVRRSNEQIGPRASTSSLSSTSIKNKQPVIPLRGPARNTRRSDWTSDDDNHVKKFREKHAATVIQRGWRHHNKSRKTPIRGNMNASRQQNLDKWSSKIGTAAKPLEIKSPRSSSTFERLGSDTIKDRPSSANRSNEVALKTVQASLRGYLNRTEIGENSSPISSRPRSPASIKKAPRIDSDDDDDIVTPSRIAARQPTTGRQPARILDQPRLNSRQSRVDEPTGSDDRDTRSKYSRSRSPSAREPLAPPPGGTGSSREGLPEGRNKLGSGNQFTKTDRESSSNLRRPYSPSADIGRPSSPVVSSSGSRQNLPKDRMKLGSGSRQQDTDQDLSSKLLRPSTPPNDRRSSRPLSPSTSHPPPRKSPTNSKQSLKAIPDNDSDDNDIVMN